MLYAEEGTFMRIAALVAYAQRSPQMRPHRQSRPHVQQSQGFAHYRQHILHIPPPAVRIKRVVRRRPHNQPRIIPSSFRHNAFTRRVYCGDVTMITICCPFRLISREISCTFSRVLAMAPGKICIAESGKPSFT